MHSLHGWLKQFDFGQANLIVVYVFFGQGAVLRGGWACPCTETLYRGVKGRGMSTECAPLCPERSCSVIFPNGARKENDVCGSNCSGICDEAVFQRYSKLEAYIRENRQKVFVWQLHGLPALHEAV